MKKVKEVYLDNASTTQIDPRVLAVMLPYLKQEYGNPSSLHKKGFTAGQAIKNSRAKIASLIDARTDEIIFTSGGTEADNLAILGIARANKNKGKHIITSVIEHKAILNSCKKLENEGFEITYLAVDKKGNISLEQFKSSLRPDTILVSVMYANNEIGTIEPVKKIAKIIKESKISKPVFHSDACQAVSALNINVKQLGVDAMTISSSKIYGPKGIGCLYLKKGISIEPIIFGGGQERGIRSGTENVAGIVGIVEALTISKKNKGKENGRLSKLRDYLQTKIIKKIDKVTVNGALKNRLPNNLNISIAGVEGESLVLLLDNFGVYCSTGSACSTNDIKSSHVLKSIGVTDDLAHCSIRLSLGRYTTKSDINYTVNMLVDSIKKIRSISTIK